MRNLWETGLNLANYFNKRNSNRVSITETILQLSNICISTIVFTIIVVLLLLYSLNKIELVDATIYIYYLLIVFVMDQLLIKPVLGFIGKNSINIKQLIVKTFPRIFE